MMRTKVWDRVSPVRFFLLFLQAELVDFILRTLIYNIFLFLPYFTLYNRL